MHLIPDITFDFLGIMLILFVGMIGLQIIYLFVFQLRLLLHKPKDLIRSELPTVSVVICARNEEDNLFKNLPIILEQDYPNFEVIVVNDQSQDDSMHIIKAFQKDYHFLKYIEFQTLTYKLSN